MAKEHSSTTPFITPNYGINTYPANEWRIVVECDTKVEQEYSRYKRKIPDWKSLLHEESARLRANSNEAHLTDVEIIAIILYTGPMVFCDIKLNLNLLKMISDIFCSLIISSSFTIQSFASGQNHRFKL